MVGVVAQAWNKDTGERLFEANLGHIVALG